MSIEDQMKAMAKRLAATPPTEEQIDMMHTKTPEELEALVPGTPITTFVTTPDGEEVPIEEYAATKKTADSRKPKKRGFKIFIHRR